LRYFPAFLDLAGRHCLVVGAGAVATPKVRLLLDAGALVTVVAPAANAAVRMLAQRGDITWRRRRFRGSDVAGRSLIYGTSGDAGVDESVSHAARCAGVPVCVVDRPALSSFVTPAIIDRDPIIVGVSSGGTAPALARRIRAAVEATLPPRIGVLARFADRFRSVVRTARPEAVARRRFWDEVFDGPIATRVLNGDDDGAFKAMLAAVNRRSGADRPPGSVAIVGAGPGAADLITLRALRLLQSADVVIHDRLVGADVLGYARRDAERLCVGKARGGRGWSQDAINERLAALAGEGKRVVRLKGGDPLVFGRGGEEAEYLRQRGIAVELIPGITAAAGCAAAAGIPLTHRGTARSVTFATGETADGDPTPDWADLARPGRTLVVYMGVANADAIAKRLLENGAEPATPVAVVENGTRPEQRVVTGRLDDLGRLVHEHAVAAPALIIVGEVVRLRAAAADRDESEANALRLAI
jgi:uroporphyrin-III C-methyltransferase/precorrin-2 dehydrogenase/sirohydrochlorin ferrochelatase